MTDTVYLTPTEWKAMAQGLDDYFDGTTDPDLEAIILRASTLAEGEVGLPEDYHWLATDYVNEQMEWHPRTRRVYPRALPVNSIAEMRLRISPLVKVTFSDRDIYVNNTQGYLELSAMTLAVGLAPDILAMGLVEPVVEFDYNAGFDVTPQKIKEAVAIIGSAQLVSKKAFEEGIAGAISFTIGSYQVTLASSRPPAGPVQDREIQQAGFANFIPEAAKTLLKNFKRIALR